MNTYYNNNNNKAVYKCIYNRRNVVLAAEYLSSYIYVGVFLKPTRCIQGHPKKRLTACGLKTDLATFQSNEQFF